MIRMDGLLKSFGTKTVLNDVSFHFPEGERIALVGANGAGKTTLLDIITGVAEADKGSILKPPRLRMGYLPQEPNAQPMTSVIEEVTSGGPGYIQDLVRRHKAALQKMTDNYSDVAHRQWEDVDRESKQERGYALDGEARDPAWDAQMQERVGGFFANAPGSHVLQIDCRASLCRVDVGVADLMAREDLARRSPDMLEEGAEMFGYVDSPDDLEVSLYLSRGGTGLPAM